MGFYVPDSLKKRAQWVVWRLELKPGRDKPDKVPYSPTWRQRNGEPCKASSTNAASWGSYADAVSMFEYGDFTGIGFVFSPGDGFVFIDIDNAIDETGEFSELAEEILHRFAGNYVEISQSETGLHIVCYGDIPRGFNNRAAGVEAYAQGRYMAFTGNALHRSEPQQAQKALNWLFNQYGSHTEPAPEALRTMGAGEIRTTTEAEALARARHSRSAEEFAALYDAGAWEGKYTSQSEADLRLMGLLWFFSYEDSEITVSLFKKSKLAATLSRKSDPAQYLARTLQQVRNSPTKRSPRASYERTPGRISTTQPEENKRKRAYWKK